MKVPRYGIVSLWDMLTIKAAPFLHAHMILCTLAQFVSFRTRDGSVPFSYGLGDNQDVLKHLDTLISCLTDIGLTATLIPARRLRSILQSGEVKEDGLYQFDSTAPSDLKIVILQVMNTMRFEMDSALFMHIGGSEAAVFANGSSLFGEIILKFGPDAKEDVDEAAKCMVVGRFTACVFHLMRAMERAVHVVGDQIGVTIKDQHGRYRTWGSIAGDMNREVGAMQKGSPERERWAEVASLLHNVNEAWRNPTNHPKRTYTEEQCREVFAAVAGFMRRLASVV